MKSASVSLVAVLLGLAACGQESAFRNGDLGTGLNTVERMYAKAPSKVWDAAVSSVKEFDLKVESALHDAMGGDLIARRADGHRVTVNVKGIDEKNTKVNVRVEPGNRNMAEMIHERIAEELGMGKARTGLFGGNSVDETYTAGLNACVEAAEKAAKALDLTVVQKEASGTQGQIDARRRDSTPVAFRFKASEDGTTRVTFISGRSKSDENRDMAQKMKMEFDRQVLQAR
jgi:hypothetical protein